jgi:hypothetical protein
LVRRPLAAAHTKVGRGFDLDHFYRRAHTPKAHDHADR